MPHKQKRKISVKSSSSHAVIKPSSAKKKKYSKISNDIRKVEENLSFLDKIKRLRNFVGTCGEWSETDLSQCLRQCNYNIEIAAEQLMTGQYSPNNSTKNKVSSSSFFSPKKKISKSDAYNSSSSDSLIELIGDEHDDEIQKSCNDPNLASSGCMANSLEAEEEEWWLLTKRWTVGHSNTRQGSFHYRENLVITSSSPTFQKKSVGNKNKNSKIVRFKGMAIEGTLIPSLGSILAPLMTTIKQNQDKKTHSKMPVAIQVKAETLMEDSHIPMGAEVPMELQIFIRPTLFFQYYFIDPDAKITSNESIQNHNNSAAFALLQWAQYGSFVMDNQSTISHTQEKDENEDSTQKGEKSFLSEEEQAADHPNDDNNDDSLSELANQLLSDNNANLNKSSVPTCGKTEEETPDPIGLNNITLRPYQRQALTWMITREQSGNNNEYDNLWKELMISNSLIQQSATSNNSNNGITAQQHTNKDVYCDCGPVIVTGKTPVGDLCTLLDGSMPPATNHPLWQARYLLLPKYGKSKSKVICFFVHELLQTASWKPPNPPKPCVGGILADAMGLGKTVMLLSLILYDAQKSSQLSPSSATTTLVVTPLSLLHQWSDEIKNKTNMTHYAYYGESKEKSFSKNFNNFDIILTTYGTLQSEYRAFCTNDEKGITFTSPFPPNNTPLLSFFWKRIILDEAHGIKNTQTLVSMACCQIQAERRWCVTGTPIQNSIQDVFGYLKFLKHEPWCESKFWKSAIVCVPQNKDKHPESPTEKKDQNYDDTVQTKELSLSRVRRIISPLLLRRTKDTMDAKGKPILTLPSVEYAVVDVDLSSPEREFYNALLDKSQSVFEGFVKAGTASKSWFAIFSLLQRLRQACDHVALTVHSRFKNLSNRDNSSSLDVKSSSNEDQQEKEIAKHDEKDSQVSDMFLKDLLRLLEGYNQENYTVPEQDKNLSHSTECEGQYAKKIAQSLTQSMNEHASELEQECAICLENPSLTESICTPCAHVFCKQCLLPLFEKLNQQSSRRSCECPVCMKTIKINTMITFKRCSETNKITTGYYQDHPLNMKMYHEDLICINKTNESTAARQTLQEAIRGQTSTKLNAVLNELDNIWESDPGSKILIFSQFLGFLDLLESSLEDQQTRSFRLDGQMNLKQRTTELSKFNSYQTNSSNQISSDNGICRGCVFLVSMKAGGVGINLVSASSVFIVDPWWNAAVEDQCINRIHRIGQSAKVVRVRKFITRNTVEEKIVKLQNKKKNMASGILEGANQLNSSLSRAQPTLADFKDIFGT